MGSNLRWATLVAGIVTLSAHAADLPLPSSGVRQITEDRWRAVLTQVQTTPGVDCQIIGSTRIYACVQRRGNGIWTFAMEGSPAFPAVKAVAPAKCNALTRAGAKAPCRACMAYCV